MNYEEMTMQDFKKLLKEKKIAKLGIADATSVCNTRELYNRNCHDCQYKELCEKYSKRLEIEKLRDLPFAMRDAISVWIF